MSSPATMGASGRIVWFSLSIYTLLVNCRGLSGLEGEGGARHVARSSMSWHESGAGVCREVAGRGIEVVQRLRGGGLIKKKSKAGHSMRKAKKRGLWCVYCLCESVEVFLHSSRMWDISVCEHGYVPLHCRCILFCQQNSLLASNLTIRGESFICFY